MIGKCQGYDSERQTLNTELCLKCYVYGRQQCKWKWEIVHCDVYCFLQMQTIIPHIHLAHFLLPRHENAASQFYAYFIPASFGLCLSPG